MSHRPPPYLPRTGSERTHPSTTAVLPHSASMSAQPRALPPFWDLPRTPELFLGTQSVLFIQSWNILSWKNTHDSSNPTLALARHPNNPTLPIPGSAVHTLLGAVPSHPQGTSHRKGPSLSHHSPTPLQESSPLKSCFTPVAASLLPPSPASPTTPLPSI